MAPAACLDGDAVADHGGAERAADRDRVRAGGDGLLDPLDVDALADPLFHPHAGAAGAAAEGALAVAGHLGQLRRRPAQPPGPRAAG